MKDTTDAGAADPGWAAPDGSVAGWPAELVGHVIERVSSPGFEDWWPKIAHTGFCARPVHLVGRDRSGCKQVVLGRCKNRRSAVCRSCSDLYSADTWQLIATGLAGGRHDVPESVAGHPGVFATLTAPGFGQVHSVHRDVSGGARRCHHHRDDRYRRCPHGKPLWCSQIHSKDDDAVGQPLCRECYDYRGHVLFGWWAPDLWRRFTITLRRLLTKALRERGEDPKSVRVSFVKVVELQARAIPHYHAVVRLDAATGDGSILPPDTSITAGELAALVQAAVARVHLDVPDGASGMCAVRFGTQIDTQPLTSSASGDSAGTAADGVDGVRRRVAGYLAKYVTKSVTEFGLAGHRMSPKAIDTLEVSEHVRAILHTLDHLAERDRDQYGAMLGWLHTLGYRGHVTSKSRRYSTTMGALRARRADWQSDPHTSTHRQLMAGADPDDYHRSDGDDAAADELTVVAEWSFDRVGHRCQADHFLAVSAAARAREYRLTARTEYREQVAIAQRAA